jgi:hypothetical protein
MRRFALNCGQAHAATTDWLTFFLLSSERAGAFFFSLSFGFVSVSNDATWLSPVQVCRVQHPQINTL